MSSDRLNSAPDEHFDPLDELLKSARWPEASSEQLRRLERTVRAQPSRVSVYRWSAAAALLVAGTALVAWQFYGRLPGDDANPQQHVVKKIVPDQGMDRDAKINVADSSVDTALKAKQSAPPVPPTAYERLLVHAAERRLAQVSGQKPLAAKPRDIEQDIERLVCGDTTADEIVSRWRGLPLRDEQRLIQLAQSSTEDAQHAAVQLLSRMGSWRSALLLKHLSATPELHADATRGLARLATPSELAAMASVEPDADLQQELMAVLLERGSPDAVELFINLASSESTSAAAFASLTKVKTAPVEALIAALEGPSLSRRLIASHVLGRLNDPRVSQRLIAEAIGGGKGREALVALLSSSDSQAAQFVAQGRQDPRWSALLQAAGSDAFHSVHN